MVLPAERAADDFEDAVELPAAIEVDVPPVAEAGADAWETPLAAAAKSSTVPLEGGLTTPTMPFWQCFDAEQ